VTSFEEASRQDRRIGFSRRGRGKRIPGYPGDVVDKETIGTQFLIHDAAVVTRKSSGSRRTCRYISAMQGSIPFDQIIRTIRSPKGGCPASNEGAG